MENRDPENRDDESELKADGAVQDDAHSDADGRSETPIDPASTGGWATQSVLSGTTPLVGLRCIIGQQPGTRPDG